MFHRRFCQLVSSLPTRQLSSRRDVMICGDVVFALSSWRWKDRWLQIIATDRSPHSCERYLRLRPPPLDQSYLHIRLRNLCIFCHRRAQPPLGPSTRPARTSSWLCIVCRCCSYRVIVITENKHCRQLCCRWHYFTSTTACDVVVGSIESKWDNFVCLLSF